MGGTAREENPEAVSDPSSLGCSLEHILIEASSGNLTSVIHVCALECRGARKLIIFLLSSCQKPTGYFAGTLILLIRCIFFSAYFKPAVNSVFCFLAEECKLIGFAPILVQMKGSCHENSEEPGFLSSHCREGKERRQWPSCVPGSVPETRMYQWERCHAALGAECSAVT